MEFVLRATQFGGNARLVPTAVMFPVALMRRGTEAQGSLLIHRTPLGLQQGAWGWVESEQQPWLLYFCLNFTVVLEGKWRVWLRSGLILVAHCPASLSE